MLSISARRRESWRPTGARRWLVWAMWLVLACYGVVLLIPGEGFNPLLDGLLSVLAVWLPALACWAAVARSRFMRAPLALCATAVTSYALGDSYYVLATPIGGSLPFPSPADAGYLLFCPFILAGLMAVVHRQSRGFPWSALLDSTVGSLGAAGVLAVVLSPILDSAVSGPVSPAAVVGVAYPMADLVLVAAVVGIAASPGLAPGRWIVLAGGLFIFAATDAAYALLEHGADYEGGTPLDAGWALGLAFIAVWANDLPRGGDPANPAVAGAGALAVPTVATAAALGILLLASQGNVPGLAVVLAGLTILLAGVRTQLAFRRVVKVADLRLLARTDDLTGLPNRRALHSDVPLRLAARRGGRSALLLLDLDRFKEVNDSLGHDIGDLLLVQIGTRLSDQLRSGDLLARLGGDEFAVLLDDAGPDAAVLAAARLRAAMAAPFTLAGISLQASASVGIALFPDHGDDLTTLLRKADMAMYKAKAARSGHHVYVDSDDNRGQERLRTLQELRVALAEEQLELHYQPKIELATGQVRGVEALVRWNHPRLGLLYPGAFLALAEETGLMRELTAIVLRLALDQAAIWQRQGTPLSVAVNFSASSLVDAGLPERIGAMLEARGLASSALTVEITEEFLMDDRDRARDILGRLRESGVRVSVDDFGTGYSSLAYLRELPIDELKLDRAFVFPMSDDPRAAALVSSTIDLAHSLGLIMVAEGVEDAAACDDLTRYGCDQAQGYFLCRPVPAAELDGWLAEHRLAAEGPAAVVDPGGMPSTAGTAPGLRG
ncbi:diguanylate cyclase (GGDEF)-like protein [Cryobacterium sp. MP_M5]|uniref:putative bifunctional diguanylate cyclase/phosphodiesterase n=1 Tax=unclassified Cryobacterium TaxID=2649013 RepID=UPI0018CBADAE|nr:MULTISPECIES: EAL domain-containing protein [unclassified Cryobacterium]MBG6056731.1 diguanylate cyclase (GGDEF)-like protein [Cryobacterium sp. MP_M3]MEC5176403.1 diguanylate cyclase (GGDEF)-like protein [Cryobacterium sp. MP_M5]